MSHTSFLPLQAAVESEKGALITADSCLQDDTVEAMQRTFWEETHSIFAGRSRQVRRATEDILGGLWQSQKDSEVLLPKDTCLVLQSLASAEQEAEVQTETCPQPYSCNSRWPKTA